MFCDAMSGLRDTIGRWAFSHGVNPMGQHNPIAVLLAAVGLAASALPAPAAEQPNIVVILSDDDD